MKKREKRAYAKSVYLKAGLKCLSHLDHHDNHSETEGNLEHIEEVGQVRACQKISPDGRLEVHSHLDVLMTTQRQKRILNTVRNMEKKEIMSKVLTRWQA